MRPVTKPHCLGAAKTQADVHTEQSPVIGSMAHPHQLILVKREASGPSLWLQIPIIVHQEGVF